MEEVKSKCYFCGNTNTIITQVTDGEREFRKCPICGQYILPLSSFTHLDKQYAYENSRQYDLQKLAAYLYHHKIESRYAFVGIETSFDEYKRYNPDTVSFIVTPETVENWYPKTFEERINYILLAWAKRSRFIGEATSISIESTSPFFFLENEAMRPNWRKELKFLIRYLGNEGLIEYPIPDEDFNSFYVSLGMSGYFTLTLSAKAWSIIYDLQKNNASNKKAFVAMKFGDETLELREKIREGIILAGYEPRIMDEIEHNHQIVPEMLYEIKNSRFVIAELSHHNNGAYYEAGFAYGLNKEVIHICSEEALKKDLHFDVVQINSITYKDINEIPEKLKKRIQATII